MSETIKTEKTILRYSEAANVLQLSESNLRRLVMLKKIPYLKIGGSVRFDLNEIKTVCSRPAVSK